MEKLHWESDKRLPVYETTLRRHYFPLCLGKIQSCDQDSEGFLRGLEPTDTRLFLSLLRNFPTHTHTPLQCPVDLIFPIKPTCMRIALHAVRAHQLSLSLFPLLLPRKWNAHFIGQIIDSFMEKFISGWSHWKLRGYLLVLKNSFKTFKVQCQNRV